MHYQSYQVLSHAATFIVEGRVPLAHLQQCCSKLCSGRALLGYDEGPHCPRLVLGVPQEHQHSCSLQNRLCFRYHLFQKSLQQFMCKKEIIIEVYIRFGCAKSSNIEVSAVSAGPQENHLLLERWTFNFHDSWNGESSASLGHLFNALRSSIHFSQLSSWLVKLAGYLPFDVAYRLCTTDGADTPDAPDGPHSHQSLTETTTFPVLQIDQHSYIQMTLASLRRLPDLPSHSAGVEPVYQIIGSSSASAKTESSKIVNDKNEQQEHGRYLGPSAPSQREEVVDDRMLVTCEMAGKHHCHAEPEEYVHVENDKPKRRRSVSRPSSSSLLQGKFRHSEVLDLKQYVEQPNPFMAAILRSNKTNSNVNTKSVASIAVNTDISFADFSATAEFLLVDFNNVSAIEHSNKPLNRHVCRSLQFTESELEQSTLLLREKLNNLTIAPNRSQEHKKNQRKNTRQEFNKTVSSIKQLCNTSVNSSREKDVGAERPVVPSAKDQLTFRRSLQSATHLIFHRNQGLPLLSSSAPRGCTPTFDYDSTLNSVSALKIALVGPIDREPESTIPISPGASAPSHGFLKPSLLSPLPMLGCFEESVLHGRIEPVSTVQGFTAEVAASGSFIPPHLHLPVTVFFYSLSENDKVTTPYLSHINLVEKGYNIPRAGTIQVTLFNPLKTVVKMFIVPYDLQDMPPNSCTFLRQRTRYEPSNQTEENGGSVHHGSSRFSRYLIHLRFCSSKSGKIYLHTDIRMLISRKTDADTAMEMRNIGFDLESYELRSSTYGPTKPKYSLKQN